MNKAVKRGKIALNTAEEVHRINTEIRLLHHDLNINAQDSLVQTALHIAVSEDMINNVHLSFEKDNILWLFQ